MKVTLLVFWLVNFQSAQAAPEDTKMTKAFCLDLVTEVTYKGFSPEINGATYKLADLNNKVGVAYIDRVRTGLATRMTYFCNSKDKVSLDDFMSPYLSECSTECEGSYPRVKMVGININQSKRDKAAKACWNVCKANNENMESIVEGIKIRNAYSGKTSADCSSEIAEGKKSQEKYEQVMKENEEVLNSLKKFPYSNDE